MNKEKAIWILKVLGYVGYDITDIYESSFRAIRKSECALTEINVECLIDVRIVYIDIDNVKTFTSVCTHVLSRYK